MRRAGRKAAWIPALGLPVASRMPAGTAKACSLASSWEGRGVRTISNGDGIVTFTEPLDQVTVKVRTATDGLRNLQRSGLRDLPWLS